MMTVMSLLTSLGGFAASLMAFLFTEDMVYVTLAFCIGIVYAILTFFIKDNLQSAKNKEFQKIIF